MGRSINQTEERPALASPASCFAFDLEKPGTEKRHSPSCTSAADPTSDPRQDLAPSTEFRGRGQVRRKRQPNCLELTVERIARAARCFTLLLLAGGAIWAAESVEPVAAPTGPALRTISLHDTSLRTDSLRTEVVPLESGAKLITFFESLPEELACANGRRELPLLAILKDTLNDSDPDNDRIRQVWVFTYSQPSIRQRMAGGVPFLYHRAGLDTGAGTKPPRAVLDLGDPSRGAWRGLALAGVQSEVLNPISALTRLTTHSFFGNYGEYRNTHLWEAGDVLSTTLPTDIDQLTTGELTASEFQAVEERLELAGHPLGGFVGDQFLEHDQEKQRTKQTETRGHNWELLRQRAEDSGLYLEALEPAGPAAFYAILWVAEADLENPAPRSFDHKFLNISNPFADERLRHWNGYSESWNLDSSGVPVPADSADAQPARMIPLALYALDHPHTPLLLIDFRGSGQPRRREIGLKIAEDVTSGVLSITGFGHLGFVALKSSWMFVHARHGGATSRSARRRAFVSVRNAIGSDPNIDPKLRAALLARIEKIDVNPIERPWDQEIRDGWQQYDALMSYARSTGLAREIGRDRGDEMRASVHGPAARALFHVASIATVGLYRHQDTIDQSQVAKLDQQRRDARRKLPGQPLPPPPEPLFASKSGSPAATEADADSAPGLKLGASQ